MAGEMEIDPQITPDDQIIKKLIEEFGIQFNQPNPNPNPNYPHQTLLNFLAQNPNDPQLVPRLVPTMLSATSDASSALIWVQWMMFRRNPSETLETLAGTGTRGVCGSVWGQNDLAYRCRTCEADSTCAICVPCFQNGDHVGHDFSIMYTGTGTDTGSGGGCCDCGDITAWKKEGFCKKHKGAEKIKPLDADLAQYVGPVLDALFDYWQHQLASQATEPMSESQQSQSQTLTLSIVEMLLNFSTQSESLLSFIAAKIKPDLLTLLINSEKHLPKNPLKKLHELFLKLIGDPSFKHQFCLNFLNYYQETVREIVNKGVNGSDSSLLDQYPLMNGFSVQLFTVPVLMERLVREVDLLGVLMGCLRDILMSCSGADGKLEVNKWTNYSEIVMRLVDDIKFITAHKPVSAHLIQARPDILSHWIQILQTLQYLDPHKRIITTLHAEDENENLAAPFVLSSFLGNVNNAISQGLFCKMGQDCKMGPDVTVFGGLSEGTHRDAKIGRLLANNDDDNNEKDFYFLTPVVYLVNKLVNSIEEWLKPEFLNFKDPNENNTSFNDLIKVGKFGRMHLIHKGKNVITRNLMNNFPSPADNKTLICKLSDGSNVFVDNNSCTDLDAKGSGLFKMDIGFFYVSFDVGTQETSFHIPLHRFLSLLLRKSLNYIFGSNGSHGLLFFERVFEGFGLTGLGSIIMEHPLRIRVLCAQIKAGMWRKNGDAVILSTEWYRLVQWLEEGLESDLFLLQCCAALSPADSFVKAVLDRFGLYNYTSLNLNDHNEYEGVLMQEMLTFLVQIIKERRFCGFSTIDNLKREIIYKLSVADVTHSQLVKSLPKDLSKSENLQQVLDSLADYSNPSGMKQGKYSLKKEHWRDLDLYHPRWSSRDLQSAQERFFRFCKSAPLNSQIPKWSPIFYPLKNIHQIATCQTTIELIRTVIYYSVFGELASSSRASESVLVVALHLTSLALDICEKELLKGKSGIGKPGIEIPVLRLASEDFVNEGVFGKKQNLVSLLFVLNKRYKEENDNNGKFSNLSGLIENLMRKFAELDSECMRVVKEVSPGLVADVAGQDNGSGSDPDPNSDKRAKARQRQAAILAKMKAEQSKFAKSFMKNVEDPKPDKGSSSNNNNNNNNNDLMDIQLEEEESVPVCSLCHNSCSQSPLCYLVLLQKSKLVTFAERGTPTWDEMGPSSSDNGSSSNGSGSDPLDEPGSPFSPGSGISLEEYSVEMDPSSDEDSPLIEPSQNPNLNPNPNPNPNPSSSAEPYSLDQIEQEIYDSILQNLNNNNNGNINEIFSEPEKGKITKTPSIASIYISCLKSDSSSPSSSSRVKITKTPSLFSSMQSGMSLVSPKREKLNGPGSGLTGRARFGPVDCDGVHVSSCGHAVHQECHERYLFSLKQRYIRRLGFEGGHIVDPDKGESLCPVCRRFANSILPQTPQPPQNPQNAPQHFPNPQNAPATLSHLTLSLSLLETALRTVSSHSFLSLISSSKTQNFLSPSLSPSYKKLSSLYFPNCGDLQSEGRLSAPLLFWDALRHSAICAEIAGRRDGNCADLQSLRGDFALGLLTGVAFNARTGCSSDVLLRFHGLTCLVGSVCQGTSLPPARGGDMEGIYPDILFWKEVSGPVLTRDPFGSLLWTLFCLPAPFLFSDEFFVPLANLFYLVSLVQALITCYSQSLCDTSCFSNSPLHPIIKQIASSALSRSFFVTTNNSTNSLTAPTECVRSLTAPFLRRCLLLKNLLTSAPRHHFATSASMFGASSASNASSADGIGELEASIGAPSLETVMRDHVVCDLVLKWAHHFNEFYNNNNNNNNNNNLGVFYCVPAEPFRLLRLPLLYQDLLQRYVKKQCAECMNVLDEPALCLLCGKLCSPSWKFCCRISKCQNHAAKCGAGIGVFLLIRKTTILLQRSVRLAFWPSPYLDAFGEEDHDMHRGRPLYLSEERYAALTHLVASHSLDRTSEVLRQTTIGLYNGD